jgi:3-deoxy-manno-octulosonate cytidylyltransferase (CMP-KDO synthetase)
VTFRIVIPARYASTRLPGKPLLPIAGRPMVEHVWRRAQSTGAREVLLATDDERIAETARGFGAEVVMTSPEHPSGTDRLAEVATQRGWAENDVVVNVQGDEPLLPAANVIQVARLLADHPEAAIATLMTPILSQADFLDPNVVKAVADGAGRALYFSRAPIPWPRDGRAAGADCFGWRHIGLYAYRAGPLRRLAALPPTPLEQTERLEQLRALENGWGIVIAPAVDVPGPGVDTAEDLERVAALLTV